MQWDSENPTLSSVQACSLSRYEACELDDDGDKCGVLRHVLDSAQDSMEPRSDGVTSFRRGSRASVHCNHYGRGRPEGTQWIPLFMRLGRRPWHLSRASAGGP
jgi:hypothetical protein